MKCYKLRWTVPSFFGEEWFYTVVSYDLASAQERLDSGKVPDRAEIVRVNPGTNEVIEVL